MIHSTITPPAIIKFLAALMVIASWGCKNSDPTAASGSNFIETLQQMNRCQVEISDVADSMKHITFYESSSHGGADSWYDTVYDTQSIIPLASNFDSVVSKIDSIVYSHDSIVNVGPMTYTNIARLSIVVDSSNAIIKKIRIYCYVPTPYSSYKVDWKKQIMEIDQPSYHVISPNTIEIALTAEDIKSRVSWDYDAEKSDFEIGPRGSGSSTANFGPLITKSDSYIKLTLTN